MNISTLVAASLFLLPGLSPAAETPKPPLPDPTSRICAILANQKPGPDGALTVAFGEQGVTNDYTYNGLAVVAQKDGLPQPGAANKVIFATQSIKSMQPNQIKYWGPGSLLLVSKDLKKGSIDVDDSASPDPRWGTVQLKDTILRVVDIHQCLSD
ncbi:MAG: hypothetical protein ACXWSD_02430, partial [Bdellovibrionota bacterium]